MKPAIARQSVRHAVAIVVAVGSLGVGTIPASAAVDFDCIDFGYQEDAQAVLDHDPADRHNLDPNGDGFACASLPSRARAAILVPAPTVPPPERPEPTPAPAPPTESEAGPRPAPGSGREETLESTIRQSIGEVNRFWRWVPTGDDWRYRPPSVQTFAGRVTTGCGAVPRGTGPFYCTIDRTVYLDTEVLEIVFDAAGDGAVRYAVAHEVAHHVQAAAGLRSSAVPIAPGTVFNVQMELHADCWSGVFLNWEATREKIDDRDAAEAAITAYAIGDPATTSIADPRAHGSPELRLEAIALGYDSGDLGICTARYIDLSG